MRPPSAILALSVVAGLFGACATGGAGAGAGSSGPLHYLSYDDGRAEGIVSFPHAAFEGLIRFQLPKGDHQLRRLWFQPAGAGTFQVTLYESTTMDSPGTAFQQLSIDIPPGSISEGRDARWYVHALGPSSARQGTIWIGFKKAGGEAALWATPLDAGQYFIRSEDPGNKIEFLPVRRTPLVRLEVSN